MYLSTLSTFQLNSTCDIFLISPQKQFLGLLVERIRIHDIDFHEMYYLLLRALCLPTFGTVSLLLIRCFFFFNPKYQYFSYFSTKMYVVGTH